MSDRPQAAVPPVDAQALTTTYNNYFRTSAGESEVILDFGLLAPQRDANGQPEPIHLQNRLVLSWHTARMLTLALHNLLQQRDNAANRTTSPPARTQDTP